MSLNEDQFERFKVWFLRGEQDQQRVRRAISELESRTSAEVLPLVVYQSSSYRFAYWRAVVAILVLTLLLSIVLVIVTPPAETLFNIVGRIILVLVVSNPILILLLHVFPTMRLTFTTQAERRDIVRDSAMACFYRFGLADTRDNSGVLLYISALEREVRILVDQGVAQKVSRNRWDALAERTQKLLNTGKGVYTVIEAIECMSAILGDSLPRRPDDENELPDLLVCRMPLEWNPSEEDLVVREHLRGFTSP